MAPEKIHGLNAGLAVLAQRPEDILSIAHNRAARHAVADLLRYAAARRLPYNEVDDEGLARLCSSVHHEGLVLRTRARTFEPPEELVRRAGRGFWGLALDGVENPHNLGGVMRSAAYFGVDGLFFAEEAGHPVLTPAAVRVAEGGAEYTPLCRVGSLTSALKSLRALGVRIVVAELRPGHRSVFDYVLAAPCVVVVGSERHGVSRAVRALCDDSVAIPGSGRIDSLNASVAAGILLAQLFRARATAS